MSDVRTTRLLVHPIDTDEATRVLRRVAGPGDAWAHDFPFEGDLIAVKAFVQHTAESGEQRPFGHYRITALHDGLAIGGIGFRGPPTGGRVEIGYGLVPSARGHGYAREALVAMLALASTHGVRVVEATTTPDNVASQRTLAHAGFTLVATGDRLHHYEVGLENTTPTTAPRERP